MITDPSTKHLDDTTSTSRNTVSPAGESASSNMVAPFPSNQLSVPAAWRRSERASRAGVALTSSASRKAAASYLQTHTGGRGEREAGGGDTVRDA